MYKFGIQLVLFFLFCPVFFYIATGEPVLKKKETLYSTKNGNPIGELSISIEAKNADPKNKEYYLIVGEKVNEIIDTKGDKKSLWVFNKKMSANELKKDFKNKDIQAEVKDIGEFTPFCENGIRFDLRDWEEIKRQTRLTFHITASPGEKMTLQLRFYVATKDKKKMVIDDEAKVKLEFVIPSAKKEVVQGGNTQGGNKQEEKTSEESLLSITEKLSADAAKRSERQADSLKQVQEQERIVRTDQLNIFITEKNKEIISLQEEVNEMLANPKNKVAAGTIDSLEAVVGELRKKVDYWDKGYTDILLNDESLQDKFTKFSTDQMIASKRIAELRQQQSQKVNWLMYFGIGSGVLMLGGMLFMQIWNPIKMKKQLKKQQQMMAEEVRKRAFDNINIKELDEI